MTNRIYLPANRSNIDSFYVMELLYNANKLQANGKKIFHLELGEPNPKTPKAVICSVLYFALAKPPIQSTVLVL